MSRHLLPFGDGFASDRIFRTLAEWDWKPTYKIVSHLGVKASGGEEGGEVGAREVTKYVEVVKEVVREAVPSQPPAKLCKDTQDPIVWGCQLEGTSRPQSRQRCCNPGARDDPGNLDNPRDCGGCSDRVQATPPGEATGARAHIHTHTHIHASKHKHM